MLLSGQTFCLSDRHGAMSPGLPHGLFIGDTRVMSGLRLTIDGHQPEALGVAEEGGAAASFVGRTGTSVDRRRLLVVRRRKLAPVLCEEIELRSSVAGEIGATVRVDVAADFADLFSVKQGHPRPHGRQRVYVDGDALCFDWVLGVVRRTTSLRVAAHEGAGEVELDEGGFTWTVAVPPRDCVRATWTVDVALGGEWVERSLGPLTHGHAAPSQSEWIEDAPTLDTDDPALARAYQRSLSDLAALRLFDPSGRRLPVVAAGAPWFMTLFGRDSLWTSLMALPVDPTLALGVLDALAHLQGKDVNARTEEEPGRIMHETRFDGANTLALEGGHDLLRVGRRHPAVRRAARRAGPLGAAVRGAVPAAAPRRPRPRLDRGLRRPGRRWLRRVPPGEPPRAGQPGLEGLVGRHAPPRRPPGRRADRPVRGAGLRVRGVPRPGRDRGGGGRRAAGGALAAEGRDAQAGLQPGLLARRPRLVRHGPRPGQAAHRRPRLQHGPLPLVRHRRRGARRGDGRAARPRPTCGPAGGSARWPRRRSPSIRRATTAARSGPTTRPSASQGSPPRAGATRPSGWSRGCSPRPTARRAASPSSSSAWPGPTSPRPCPTRPPARPRPGRRRRRSCSCGCSWAWSRTCRPASCAWPRCCRRPRRRSTCAGLRLWDGRFDVRCRGGQVDVSGLPDGRRAELA